MKRKDKLAEEKIKDINEAYKVLSENTSKRKYDRIWLRNNMKVRQQQYKEESKVIEPEQGEVEKKPEPKHSVTEKMKYLQEQKKQLEPKSPQHKQKKQNMEL